MLKSSPQLLHATVSAGSLAPNQEIYDYGKESLKAIPFLETHVYCEDNGIAFTLLESNIPHHLEHICNSTHVRIDPTQPIWNDLEERSEELYWVWEEIVGADVLEDEAPDFEW